MCMNSAEARNVKPKGTIPPSRTYTRYTELHEAKLAVNANTNDVIKRAGEVPDRRGKYRNPANVAINTRKSSRKNTN